MISMEAKVEGRGVASSIFLFIIIVALIIAFLYFSNIIFWLIVILGVFCVIGLIIGVIAFGIISIFALGYFAATKKPEIQEHADYKLEETIDSKDYEK
jgi:hypothetical protein